MTCRFEPRKLLIPTHSDIGMRQLFLLHKLKVNINRRMGDCRRHQLLETFEKAGQGHVIAALLNNTLNEEEGKMLLDQLDEIDPFRVNEIFESSMKALEGKIAAGFTSSPSAATAARVDPLDTSGNRLVMSQDVEKNRDIWYDKGIEMVRKGRLGVLLLAGGQGTRLGSSKPKGCYDVGLPSKKSLFQLQAERIHRLQDMASTDGSVAPPIRWYVMTSPATDKDTKAFFDEKKYFGLQKEQIVFFCQGMLPALTLDGKIILEDNARVSMAPDGNGGVYVALEKHGVLDDMEKHGIDAVDCCSVDNILVRVGDPVFIGYCASYGIECGARVVAKSCPEEKVGVFAERNGKLEVVEYSELDPSEAEAVDPETELLKYNWSNVCLHYFDRGWLKNVSSHLLSGGDYHVAKKKIPSMGKRVDGIKLELFIFDPFPLADEWGLMEIKRDEQFAPVKNAPGSPVDSPDTAREAVMSLHRNWVEAQGGIVVGDGGLEVSPLISYAGENLEWVQGRTFHGGEYISEEAHM